MTAQVQDARKKRVFDSVFGGPLLSQPTPVATPATGFAGPGQGFGVLPPLSHSRQHTSRSAFGAQSQGLAVHDSDHVRDQVQWDRSWHNVTHILNVPDVPDNLDTIELSKSKLKAADAGFKESLKDILEPQTRLPYATHTEDIIIWHTNQVRHNFLRQILPILSSLGDDNGPEELLSRSVKVLEAAHDLYLHGLQMIVEALESNTPGSSREVVQRFRRDLHAVISNSITAKLTIALKAVLKHYVFEVLGLPSTEQHQAFVLLPEGPGSEQSRRGLLAVIGRLRNVGLAGESLQIAFAEIMNEAMILYVYVGCKGMWLPSNREADTHQTSNWKGRSIIPRTAHATAPSQCVTDLCEWIENRYSQLVVQVFDILDKVEIKHLQVSLAQVEKWKEMAIGHLASLRTNELFDIVVNWPHSSGALEDLRTAITTPQRRLNLTNVFASTLNDKLLHPGTSTLQILQTYISMIRSFHALDHSKVLLDRVAYPLQLYLCSREDTVKIVITGLLADTEDALGNSVGPGGDKLVELALLLNKGEEQIGQRSNEEELDWHDMEWMPDPVDAGPGYKRSKNADIIGTLIGVLGSQDVFIKEFQNIIGENLLKYDGGFEKEVCLHERIVLAVHANMSQIKVLELLKGRFGEAPLQSCEVMLKDIQDSGRVNSIIRRNQRLEPSYDEINIATRNFDIVGSGNMIPEGMLKPSLHAKILSRLFWPQLHDESFRVPDEVAKLHKLYEGGFEFLKASRKLTWLHALGQATVELDLTDRVITEEVHTWQATVIWAFSSDESGDPSLKRSVQELVKHLEMDEALVRSALKFWTNKLVLQEIEKDVFIVLETLNQEDRARSNAQAAASAAAAPDDVAEDAALIANDGITKENGQVYWQFIQGMLKNSSSQMPLQQIAMMLKMFADGFPYSNEELQELLDWKVADGELEFAGGKYKLKK